jgi:hypothetical protein
MPNYYANQYIERCNAEDCKRPVIRGLGTNKKTNMKYLTYTDYCKLHTN